MRHKEAKSFRPRRSWRRHPRREWMQGRDIRLQAIFCQKIREIQPLRMYLLPCFVERGLRELWRVFRGASREKNASLLKRLPYRSHFKGGILPFVVVSPRKYLRTTFINKQSSEFLVRTWAPANERESGFLWTISTSLSAFTMSRLDDGRGASEVFAPIFLAGFGVDIELLGLLDKKTICLRRGERRLLGSVDNRGRRRSNM